MFKISTFLTKPLKGLAGRKLWFLRGQCLPLRDFFSPLRDHYRPLKARFLPLKNRFLSLRIRPLPLRVRLLFSTRSLPSFPYCNFLG